MWSRICCVPTVFCGGIMTHSCTLQKLIWRPFVPRMFTNYRPVRSPLIPTFLLVWSSHLMQVCSRFLLHFSRFKQYFLFDTHSRIVDIFNIALYKSRRKWYAFLNGNINKNWRRKKKIIWIADGVKRDNSHLNIWHMHWQLKSFLFIPDGRYIYTISIINIIIK